MVFEELILGKSLTKYRITAGGMASCENSMFTSSSTCLVCGFITVYLKIIVPTKAFAYRKK
jgi:hypothetical protein